MVRVLAVGIGKPGTGINKGTLHQEPDRVPYKKVSCSWQVAWVSAPMPSIAARRCRAVCRCAARWLVSISRTRAEILRCSCTASAWRASYCQSSSKTCVLCILFSPRARHVTRESPGTLERQAGAGLAVLKALTIVAQGGELNKDLHLTTFSVRSCLAPASRRA